MKGLTNIAMSLILAAAMQAFGQESRDPHENDRTPPRHKGDRKHQEALTVEQVAKVKEILAKYDPKTLTTESARAIHQAFRQAGLRGGPAMHDAIVAAGFDPEKLRELAPPPRRDRNQGRPEKEKEPEGADQSQPQE